MRRGLAGALALVAWVGWLFGMAHLSAAGLKNHRGELGPGLDHTIAGARWVSASLLPFAGVLALRQRRRRRRRAPQPAPAQPLQHLADRPGGLPVSALVPWHPPRRLPH